MAWVTYACTKALYILHKAKLFSHHQTKPHLVTSGCCHSCRWKSPTLVENKEVAVYMKRERERECVKKNLVKDWMFLAFIN